MERTRDTAIDLPLGLEGVGVSFCFHDTPRCLVLMANLVDNRARRLRTSGVRADKRDMTDAPNGPDVGAMRVELEILLAEEQEVSADRAQLHARIDESASPLLKAEAAKLSAIRRDLHARIDRLRDELNLLTR